MQVQHITAQQAVQIVNAHKHNNKVFGVLFIKKNNTQRKAACRFKVTAHTTKTGTPSTTAHIAKYVTVFDMHKQAHINVNLETLIHIVSKQVKYIVQH